QALRGLIVPAASGGSAQVRGLGVVVDVSDAPPAAGAPKPALVFLAQPLSSEHFRLWLEWCVAEGVILYSPFEGDVERGATAGLSVQAKVQPYVNLQTLKSSGIRLRRFYVEHSRVLP
ncbi:MAG TPA: hypothetical protein VFY12_02015, partial [Arenimonas sp.]|nr:hypothetical protein [Arenimonas sp.]